MTEQMTASSVHEVLAAEPVIRRVIAARVANAADVDDLVQDCLERLLVAHPRLSPEAVLPYAVVTARNLVSSTARSAMRRAAAAPRLHDASQPELPEETLLAGEARTAMRAALAQLSDAERRELLASAARIAVRASPASNVSSGSSGWLASCRRGAAAARRIAVRAVELTRLRAVTTA